jgi:predicted RecA/RadA family phage recombinase
MAYEATFLWHGDTIKYTPSGAAVSAGEVIVVGEFVAVARNDIADGEEGVLYVVGVYEVDKEDSTTFTAGQIVYWDASENEASDTDDSGTNKKMGIAVAAQAGTEATDKVQVRLER